MRRTTLRTALAWAIFAAMGCSGLGGGCGGCTEPIPGGFPADERSNNAITAKVSEKGLRFIEGRVGQLIDALTGTGLAFDVPCTTQNVALSFPNPIGIGPDPIYLGSIDAYICDVDDDRQCPNSRAIPVSDDSAPTSPPLKACQAKADIKSLKLTPTQASPTSPVEVAVNLQLRVNTGRIPVTAQLPSVLGISLGSLGCNVEFDSNKAAPADLPVNVRLKLTVDPAYENVLAFDLLGVDITKIVDLGDVNLAGNGGGFSNFICGSANFVLQLDFLTQAIENLAKNLIDSQVRNILDGFRCRACASDRDCPASTTCQNKLCYAGAPSGHQCAPTLLGLQGRVGVGNFLASFGGQPESLLDLYAVAGGATQGTPDVKVENGGIVLGIMGGTRPAIRKPDGSVKAPGVAACVPQRSWTARSMPTPVKFDTEAAAPSNTGENLSDYQIGLAFSDNFLDKSMFDAFQSGLLCLNVDAGVSTFLSSSLFNTFLPSLRLLTHGQDVPMMIALRPKQAPQVLIGKGSTKKVNGQDVPDDPLLTIQMKEVSIDFYAFVEERYARLFSLKTDINLPLSLKFDRARNTVQPVLANLETVVSNIDAQNSEMLAENPQIVADLLSAIIGLVQPILASVLAPIELPTLSGLKLVVRDARGVVPYGSATAGFQHMALFANLELGSPDRILTETDASLFQAVVPTAAALLGPEKARPHALIDVRGLGLQHLNFKGYEYSFRVDGGLWSPWTTETRIDVASPVLMMPGRHLIEVTSRELGEPASEDATPARVSFVVDYEAPRTQLVLDPETRQIRTVAHDGVSRDDELTFRYRVAGRDWAAYVGPQSFSLDELGSDPSLEVEVTDAAGHAGTAYFGTPAAQLGDATMPANLPANDAAGGCATGGASLLALAGLARALRRRKA